MNPFATITRHRIRAGYTVRHTFPNGSIDTGLVIYVKPDAVNGDAAYVRFVLASGEYLLAWAQVDDLTLVSSKPTAPVGSEGATILYWRKVNGERRSFTALVIGDRSGNTLTVLDEFGFGRDVARADFAGYVWGSK